MSVPGGRVAGVDSVAEIFAGIATALRKAEPALRPLSEWQQRDPEGFEAACAEAKARAYAPRCHCWCQVIHGGTGVCTGEAEPGLMIPFDAVSTGLVHVPFCRACAEALSDRAA